jgi:hypothetical protein
MGQKEARRMKRSELTIGQTVYIEPVGNATRYGWDANPYAWVYDFEVISKSEAMKESEYKCQKKNS